VPLNPESEGGFRLPQTGPNKVQSFGNGPAERRVNQSALSFPRDVSMLDNAKYRWPDKTQCCPGLKACPITGKHASQTHATHHSEK